mmetsp:Transcript_20911/g.23884  ORF Transcript_20911/g.23884 Transcript_20911/m.23884 type:complete len:510 (+) Transcript_20911:98-1627(+)
MKKMHRHILELIWIGIASIVLSAVESVAQLPYWARETNLRNDLLSGNEVNFGIEYDPVVPPKTDNGENTLVKVGINVFKIKEIDIATSLMSLNMWVRLSWKDARLAWNASDPKYLDVDHTTFKASTDPDSTQIWVPDLELYNQAESLSSFPEKDAMVYPDGSIFWSRIGNMEVLCAFSGLMKHPFDKTECSIDLAGWTRSGRFANYTFMDPPVDYQQASSKTPTSMTTYQEYAIVIGADRTSRREVLYDCCPNEPWPTLTFTFVFERLTTSYYMRSLVIVMVIFTFVAGCTCKLDIRCGERLGFGITILLAMVATEIIASEMLPTCPEYLWIEVITFGSTSFAGLCLFESCLVTHIYYKQRKEDISEFVKDANDTKSSVSDDVVSSNEKDDMDLKCFVDSITTPEDLEKLASEWMENITPCDGNENINQNNGRNNRSRDSFFRKFSMRKKKKSAHEKWSEERGLSMESFKLAEKIDHNFFIGFMSIYPLFLIVMYSSVNLFEDGYAVNL